MDGLKDVGEWRTVAWFSDRGRPGEEIRQAMYESPLRGAKPGEFKVMPETWYKRELGHMVNLRNAAYFRLQEYTALFPQMRKLLTCLAKVFAAECEKEYEFVQSMKQAYPDSPMPHYVEYAESPVPNYPEVYLRWIKAIK